MTMSMRCSLLILALSLLAGCYPLGNATRPIPLALLPAPQPAHRLVVFLPGRGDDLDALKRSGIAQIIQHEWPDADVELAALTMAYYSDGHATQRLHDEVMVPARRRGYAQIWLAGTSLGGMGSLLYERDYPGELHGMLLLAPYLGEDALRDEIIKSGGLASWNPGLPQTIGMPAWQRELWRYLKSWVGHPAKTRQVWLAYGDHDHLRGAIELVSPQLPRGHVFMLPGGHRWTVWKPAMRELLQAASRDTKH
ncbi:MAG TPA: alpha/beta hydrolase-fold protein [Rhodanobacter sp.]